jgi:Ser/Thr protein kinase RdoA (MazF antagonist)
MMPNPNDNDVETTVLLEKLRLFLEKHYDTGILSLTRLERGVYRASRTTGKDWVVRIFPTNRRIENVRGDADLLFFLEKSGFPAERCAASDPVSTPGGRCVLITEWIEGKVAEHNAATMRMVGEMHGRLAVLPINSGPPMREAGSLHHYSSAEGCPRSEIEAASRWLEEVRDKVPSAARAAYESLSKQLANADDCHDLPKALIHPDPLLKNVIISKTNGPILIDWTGAGRGPRLYALGILVWTSAFSHDGLNMDCVDSVVEGYRSHLTPTAEELARLANVMQVRPLIFACWRLRRAILVGKKPEGGEWWWPSPELAEEIASRARSVFR